MACALHLNESKAQFDLADDKKKGLERSVANLEKAIAKEKEGIAALAAEIKALQEGIAALDKSVAEATVFSRLHGWNPGIKNFAVNMGSMP